MKLNIARQLISLCFLTILIVGCSKMDDAHEAYTESGEIVYRVIPVNAKGYAGYYRAKLTWDLKTPTSVVKCEVYNGDTLLKEIAVSYNDSVHCEIILDNLEEKAYTFSIYSLDEIGNRSIKKDVFVNVLGDRYRSTLKNRSILKKNRLSKEKLYLLFGNAEPEVKSSTLTYINKDGVSKIISIEPSLSDTILEDIPSSGELKYETLLIPDSMTIDTFLVNAEIIDISKIIGVSDKSKWGLVGFSSQELVGEGSNSGGAIFSFDNDLGTYWHTQYIGYNHVYPHWVLLDLGDQIKVTRFEVSRRSGNSSFPSLFMLELSNDNVNWYTEQFTANQTVDGLQQFTLQTPTAAKYVRFTGLEDALHGSNNVMCIGEFDFYGLYE